jgi:hypothetical protein
MRAGLIAEFLDPAELVRAVREMRAAGYSRLDAFTPYPVREVEDALELPRSPLTWMVLPFGLSGAAAAYFIQWWCNAHDYPLNVGGRPLSSAPAWIPITFEMGILASALSGLVILLALCRLPALYSPLHEVAAFRSASIDGFWLGVDARDPKFAADDIEQRVKSLGAVRVAHVGGEA